MARVCQEKVHSDQERAFLVEGQMCTHSEIVANA